jgi:LuxR family maltose regulon positive regulatory protein
MNESLTQLSADSTEQVHCSAASSLLQAHFALANGESTQARQALQHALALCKNEGSTCFHLLNQKIVSDLLHWSYQQGIEPDFVRHSIQTMQLETTSFGQAQTPRSLPIMIYSLGRFSINIDNELVIDNCHGRNKPLELLKVLICLGGRQVSQDKLTEILWPDAGGDAALRNFNTTLHRLRKLLRYHQALVLKDTLLTLNTRYVQVDLWDIERLLGQMEQLLHYVHVNEQQLQQLSDRLFALFHGDFLGNEPDRNWSLLIKERLRNRMLKVLQLLGRYWQNHRQPERAREVFERGLALDPLHEMFYQHLMLLHIEKGHHSHAAAIYEKCRKVLATSLGVMPSSRTLTLYQQTRIAP